MLFLFYLSRTMVTEVGGEGSSVRAFVVQSEECLSCERAMPEAAMEKPARRLRNLPCKWWRADSRTSKIGVAAAHLLGRQADKIYPRWSAAFGSLSRFSWLQFHPWRD